MSYNIELRKPDNNGLYRLDKPLKAGGIQEVGGNKETWLYVTYNYSWYYYMFFDKRKGLMWINNKKAEYCIRKLRKAIKPFLICSLGLSLNALAAPAFPGFYLTSILIPLSGELTAIRSLQGLKSGFWPKSPGP